MDYCAVGSVKDLMTVTVEPLEEEQMAEVCAGVVRGLAYLHSHGIIHLDVKAGNIMLTEEGQVKLGDFGVSEPLRKSGRVTLSNSKQQLVGSPLFMAPEVIMKRNYNSKADIWSLGITLIELAEARPPNNDITCVENLELILTRPIPTLKRSKQYSTHCNDFLSKCLTKDPFERPDAMALLNHPFVQGARGISVLTGAIRNYMELKRNADTSDDYSFTRSV